MTITVTSDIPIASGLGSGAAITAAIIRALAAYLDLADLASDEWVSQLTFEVEKIHHGTPSGIDNTVVAYERPVYFMRRQPQNLIETFAIAATIAPARCRYRGQQQHKSCCHGCAAMPGRLTPRAFERIFDGCGRIAGAARAAIEAGDLLEIGRLMTQQSGLA